LEIEGMRRQRHRIRGTYATLGQATEMQRVAQSALFGFPR
jgi:hypothetical protein